MMLIIFFHYFIDIWLFSVILIFCFIGSQMFDLLICSFLSLYLSISEVVKDNIHNERPKDEKHQWF